MLDEDVADRLETDVRVVFPGPPAGFQVEFVDEGAYESYGDEWGVRWRMPKEGGFYYDMYYHPLARAESLADLRAFKFPDPVEPHRFVGMRQRAEAAAAKGKAITLSGAASGIVEVYSWLRGYEQFYTDLAVNPDWVAYMVDRMVEFKMAYWERALQEVGDLVDVVLEFDDMAGQQTLLFSPATYRKVIKPRHQRLFARIHQLAPTAKLFLHSCGAIRPLIPDLIDIGVDILNPVQISAAGMNLRELKRDFGREHGLLGRWRRHAGSAGHGHSGAGQGPRARQYRGAGARRRVHLRAGARRAGERAAREPRRDVGSMERVRRLPDELNGRGEGGAVSLGRAEKRLDSTSL